MDVQDKKIILFGGTSGIGAAAARQLADRGAKVVAISRDPSKAGDPGKGISFEKCDARDGAAVAALLKSQAPYDVLISAATGGERAVGPFLEMDMDGFKNSFDKLWGYANVVRYGTEHFRKTVVSCWSRARQHVARAPAKSPSARSGGAVEQFARTIAREIAPLRINVVSPGQIDTPLVPLQGEARSEMYAKATAGNLIPRAGTADEVAQAIVFAVENEFITGTTIDVDGGLLQA